MLRKLCMVKMGPQILVLNSIKTRNLKTRREALKKVLILALSAGVAVASGLATATADPIAERKALMKSVGGATGASAKMVKGQMDFDQAAAQKAMETMHMAALQFGELFPEGSETGGETTASPNIWSDRDGFNAKLAKFIADTGAAAENPAADLDSFKAQFGQVAGNCKACHVGYRIPK